MDSSLGHNKIIIEGCGTEFVNGIYTRSEQFQYSKQAVHPYTNKIITLEIRKHTDSNTLPIPESLYHKHNDELYVISCVTPCIHYYLCIVHYFGFVKSKNKYQWMSIGGLEPLPKISPMDNIKTYFDFPFYNNHIGKIENALPMDQKQLVKASNIFSHFKRYKAPIYSSWIELDRGLKGGQCLKMEMNRSYKIWDILREIADMNGLSPWNIRLKHVESGLYVHYLWNYSLFQIVQLIENEELNKDILDNKFAFQPNHHHCICYFSQFDETCSYKSTYLPCNDNVESIQNMIEKHEEYLSKEAYKAVENNDDDSKAEKEEMEIEDRDKHKFIATRVWDKHELNIYFGDKKQCVLLEDCSAGCQCWSDDVAGCRIGYIIEQIFKIPLKEQGWIVNGRIIDYFDEYAANLIFQSDANLILYSKQFTQTTS